MPRSADVHFGLPGLRSRDAGCVFDILSSRASNAASQGMGNPLMSREHHFESVVAGGTPAVAAAEHASPVREQTDPAAIAAEPHADETIDGPRSQTGSSECDANCDAAGVRTEMHGAAKHARTRCRLGGYSVFFGNHASFQNWPAAGGRAKKQPAGAMDGNARLPAWRAGPRKKKPARARRAGRAENGGDRIRTCDLEVMSLASYRAAPPRDGVGRRTDRPVQKSDRPMRTTPS